MKVIKKMGAQGDMMIIRRDNLPNDLTPREPVSGKYVLAHSETGHHHSVEDECCQVFDGRDNFGMICYLKVEGEYADIVHHRSYDTHETLRLPKGNYEIRRQREYTPEGWRRVED